MKAIILDSSQEITLHHGVPDSATLPPCRIKSRVQPVLGHNMNSFTDFVPVHDQSGYIKDLLSLKETDSSPPKPILDAPRELKKSETIMKGEDQSGLPLKEHVLDENFEQAAKTYMRTSKPETLEKFPEIADSEDAPP